MLDGTYYSTSTRTESVCGLWFDTAKDAHDHEFTCGECEGAVAARQAGGVTTAGGNRFANFLRASWAELQRVQWPDRRQVGQATAVVIGFVIVAGLYLGIADRAASELVDLIL